MIHHINTPITKNIIKDLHAGDIVYITGLIYTGRDAAHKRLVNSIQNNESLPFSINNQVIYYVGPTPTKPGFPIGSCGPTSSYRMDKYSKYLMGKGLLTMIGKGDRSGEFLKDMVKFGGVYLQAIGGTGSLISTHVKESKIIAYEDLGAEAIYELSVSDFCCYVSNDMYGADMIKTEIDKYKEK
jgi:fumarate hydratase subunit beta